MSTKKRVTALLTHLKKPKVTKFRGSKRRLIIGRAKRLAKAKAAPTKKMSWFPLSKIIPLVISETRYRAKISTLKILKILFTSF